MTRKPVHAAIVGLGRWGQNLVRASNNNSGSALLFTHAMTRSPVKAERFCQDHKLKLSACYQSILANPDLEAVVLATPHSQHGAQICAAAEAGKHVFVEKPLALTLAEAQKSVRACQAHKVRLQVGFNRRYLPAFGALQRHLQAKTLGQALHIEGNFCGSFGYDYTSTMWRGSSEENPAGGMAAMGIHIVDAMIALLGPVYQVRTLSKRQVLNNPLDDTTHVQLEFLCGATGSLSTLMATAFSWRLQLFGSNGWCAIEDQRHLKIRMRESEGQAQDQTITFPEYDTLRAELHDFANLIRSTETHDPVAVKQALAGVAAMEAITRSAQQQSATITVTSSRYEEACSNRAK